MEIKIITQLCRKPLQRKISYFILILYFFTTSLTAFGKQSGGILTGRVVNKRTGKPVSRAVITVIKKKQTWITLSRADGYFTFIHLIPGDYTLKIQRVGYKTKVISKVPLEKGTTFYQVFRILPIIYTVKGLTVISARNQTIHLRQTMTSYTMGERELKAFLPGPASLNTTSIMEELPGVQTYAASGGYALSMPGGPHIRGGSGFGTVYALDGIPLTNYTLFEDSGNLGLTTGMETLQFFPGVYPVQYGSGIDGYENTIVPEGFGRLHGSLQFSYGFWLDQGENSPLFSADPATGEIGSRIGYSGIRPSNPDNWDLRLEGQSGRFHYFFNTISENEGMSGYLNSAGEEVMTYSGIGGQIYRKVARDGILNLTYNLDEKNILTLLLADGFDFESAEFTYYSPSGTQAEFSPVPPFNYQFYNLESLRYHHYFSPISSLSLRFWLYDSNPDFYSATPADGFFSQYDLARQKGVRLEYKDQINKENKITLGGEYIYTNDTQEMTNLYPNPLGALTGNPDFGGANNQNPSLWVNDEWTPLPDLDMNAGIRWDKMIYQAPYLPGMITQPNGLPYAVEGFTGFSPDLQINNPADPEGLFTHCTPQFNICVNSGILSPSFFQPRISISYQLTHSFALKAGYGKFNTFTSDTEVFGVSNLCAARTGALYGIPCKVIGNVGYTTAGNLPESGDNYEFSMEYFPNSKTYLKITPYLKTVKNPIIYTYIPIAEAGGAFNAASLTAEGVEFQLHTQNWHHLSSTLNYTYNNSTIVGNPEYIFPFLPEYNSTSTVTGAGIFQPNLLPNAASLYEQANTQSIPADWNIKHTVNLLLDYKPNKKWEIAPNFTFTSGQPYGMGSAQLKSFYVNMAAACGSLPNPNDPYLTPAACAEDLPANGDFNPLGETLPNSLTGPSVFLANLAITYHASRWFSTTFSVFNLFNNGQILAYNSTPYFPTFMGSFGYPFSQDYSPVKGKYPPIALEPIREFFMTTTFKF